MSQGSQNPDIRWKQRFQSFRKAFLQLFKAVEITKNRDLSDLEKQGLIQAFEFTHELAWKTLKDFLESRGEGDLYGSRDVTRRAFAAGLIEDGETWMEMIQSRNRSSHTYNETVANGIAAAVTADYADAFGRFEKRFLDLECKM